MISSQPNNDIETEALFNHTRGVPLSDLKFLYNLKLSTQTPLLRLTIGYGCAEIVTQLNCCLG